MNELLTKDNKPSDLANRVKCDTIKDAEHRALLGEAVDLLRKMAPDQFRKIMGELQ
jgi:hypothetical protein